MTITSNTPAATSTVSAADKGWTDWLGPILTAGGQVAASSLGIDPRIVGQTMSQALNIFGIGGPGKAFSAAIPKDQAVAQMRKIVEPYLGDEAFKTALQSWLTAAVEPAKAYKAGKAYQPDLTKDWLSDAFDWVGDTVSSVPWDDVVQVGMEVLPFALALL